MDAIDAYKKGTEMQFETAEFKLGPHTSYCLLNDARHLCFTLSRYKFCAKMLCHKKQVLEIGCGDGFGVPIVAQAVEKLYCIDWDIRQIRGNSERLKELENVVFELCDITKTSPSGQFDAVYSIDVIEHIDPEKEKAYLNNIVRVLTKDGVLIIGTPNKEAEIYCTRKEVAIQHINLKTQESLYIALNPYFDNIFLLGMNDEVVHTGFGPLCHFLWAICVGIKTIFRFEER